MKAKNVFALFITITVLLSLSGCGKPNTSLKSENADLKARVQKLEQQLQAAKGQTAPPGAQQTSIQDLKSQLDEAQKKAEEDANKLATVSSLVETQKANIDDLMRELSTCQQATIKAEKALKLYQDKAASAIKEFKALRSTMGGQTAKLDSYHQNYVATQTAVAKLAGALPESQVRRAILGVLATFTHVNDVWVTADLEMQARTKEARAGYDKLVSVEGIGPNEYLVKMGKDRILAPAEKENTLAASRRDQQMAASVKDIDLGIKNLQALVSGPKT